MNPPTHQSAAAPQGGREPGPRLGVVVPAAGAGKRMGGLKKQYLLLSGRPVLAHAIQPFLDHEALVRVVVAVPAEDAAQPPAWLTGLDPRVVAVEGGASRGESVYRALQAMPEVEVIMVHDGARPLVSRETVEACFRKALEGVGAVAGVPAVDTLKEVDGDQTILGTPDRKRIWHAHTPQSFPAGILREAYEAARGEGFPATDDAALVEGRGTPVVMVRGNPENLKVTRPQDLPLAQALMASRRPS